MIKTFPTCITKTPFPAVKLENTAIRLENCVRLEDPVIMSEDSAVKLECLSNAPDKTDQIEELFDTDGKADENQTLKQILLELKPKVNRKKKVCKFREKGS